MRLKGLLRRCLIVFELMVCFPSIYLAVLHFAMTCDDTTYFSSASVFLKILTYQTYIISELSLIFTSVYLALIFEDALADFSKEKSPYSVHARLWCPLRLVITHDSCFFHFARMIIVNPFNESHARQFSRLTFTV